MSYQATAWALEQDPKGPSAKVVLLALAAYADKNGQCYPARERLATETCQSVATVDRRLKDLENMGFIRRERRLREDGADTTSMVTLLFDADRLRSDMLANRTGEPIASIASAQEGAAHPDSAGDRASDLDPTSSDLEGEGVTGDEGPSSLVMTQEQSLNRQINTTLSDSEPQTRENAREGEAPKDSTKEDQEFEQRWDKFARCYPFTGSMPRIPPKKAFRALPIKDQLKAIRIAAIYAENCKAEKRKHPRDAEQWLRDREFDELARTEQASAEAQGLKKPLVFVRKGSDGWNAHRTRYFEDHPQRCSGRKPSEMTDDDLPPHMRAKWSDRADHKCYGGWFSDIFPPRRDAAATGPPSSQAAATGDDDTTIDF
jgi:hypothetical protein